MIKKKVISAISAAVIALTMSAAPLPITEFSEFAPLSASAVSSVRIRFDAAGGTCSTSYKSVTVGQTYGTLPTPTRKGFQFMGWFSSSGQRITSSTVCVDNKAHTLTAGWKQNSSCTITFNANGGSVTSTSKNYKAGTIMGALPVARKDGYTFKGWYTAKTGGTRISYNTVLQSVYNRTFYAQYSVPTPATLKYSFDNSYDTYGYDYDIPYSIYKYMLGTKNGRLYYDIFSGNWGGNCFGMSSTSAFLNTGKIKVQSFNNSVYFIKELSLTDYNSSLGMNVRQFIECMQIAQYTDRAQYLYNSTENDYTGLVNRVKACQNGTGKPLVISTLDWSGSGHAVVGYKWKKISSREERIYLYDCNWPDETQYISLYKNSSGKYTGFYFDLGFGDFISSDYGGTISYFDFNELWKIWSNRSNTGKYSKLAINSQNAEIYSAAGICCARIVDGELISNSENIFEGQFADVEFDGKIIYLPDGDYTVVNKDDDSLEVSLCGSGSLCTVTSDSATVKLSADDEAGVEIAASEGDSYDITIVTDDEEYSSSGCADADGRIVFDGSAELEADSSIAG